MIFHVHNAIVSLLDPLFQSLSVLHSHARFASDSIEEIVLARHLLQVLVFLVVQILQLLFHAVNGFKIGLPFFLHPVKHAVELLQLIPLFVQLFLGVTSPIHTNIHLVDGGLEFFSLTFQSMDAPRILILQSLELSSILDLVVATQLGIFDLEIFDFVADFIKDVLDEGLEVKQTLLQIF